MVGLSALCALIGAESMGVLREGPGHQFLDSSSTDSPPLGAVAYLPWGRGRRNAISGEVGRHEPSYAGRKGADDDDDGGDIDVIAGARLFWCVLAISLPSIRGNLHIIAKCDEEQHSHLC